MTSTSPPPARLDVRELDVRDDAAMRGYHRVQQAAFGHGRPRFTPTPYDELVAVLRRDDPDVLRVLLGASEGEQLVGMAVVFASRVDDRDHAWLFVGVDPAHRWRGIGRALAAEGLHRIAAEGRRVVSTEVEVDGAVSLADAIDLPGVAFARGLGFSVDAREVARELVLPADPDHLADLDARAARALATGYRVDVLDGLPTPADLARIVTLDNLVEVDAPTGSREVGEAAGTVESAARRYRARLDEGQRVVTVVTRDRDGVVVGHSRQARAPRADAPVEQDATYVRRDHRGHGLGAAMKAAGLRWWSENAPAGTPVRTRNAEDNAPMVAINDAAGFVPVETSVSLVLRR